MDEKLNCMNCGKGGKRCEWMTSLGEGNGYVGCPCGNTHVASLRNECAPHILYRQLQKRVEEAELNAETSESSANEYHDMMESFRVQLLDAEVRIATLEAALKKVFGKCNHPGCRSTTKQVNDSFCRECSLIYKALEGTK